MKTADHGPDLVSLHELVDLVPALIHTARPDGYIDFFNQRWLEFVGLRLEDLEGWKWTAAVHPDDVDALVSKWRACLASGEPFGFESRVRRADGDYRWMLHQKLPLRNASGEIVKWYGSSVDIDNRMRAEFELRQRETEHRRSEAYLAEAQRLSQTGSFGWKPRSGEIVWSEETYRIFECDGAEPPTLEMVLERTHPQDRALTQLVIERASTTGADFEHEHRLIVPSGAIKHLRVRARAVRDAAGDIEFIGAVTDITERKAAEAKIREQETGLWQMLDFAPQLVAVFGPTFDRLYVNRMARSYLGVTLDEWLHREIPSDVHPDDAPRLQANVEQSIQSGSPSGVEVRARGGDGTYRWFLARHNPVRDDDGRIVRWYAGLTDIDDRKRAEERLEQENVALREEIDKTSMFEEVVGTSAALASVLAHVSKVARSDSTVLITGETGTGKELVARAIHRRSGRAARAFVGVNCAAIPRDLIASELFGHEKGAFTGAVERRLGRFELADRGTLFLDEVGELSPDTQVALLRVLQEREFERVGGRQAIRVDVRVIAATNRDLNVAVADGRFRQDLFYRLNVFPIAVPPLRERADDIPLLVEYFIDRYARKAGKTIRRVNKRTLDRLKAYPWPGNVRELQNVIERSVIVCDGDEFIVDASWLSAGPAMERRLALSSALAGHEKTIIEDALRASGGRVFGPSGAAARLGIARSTLESKIRALGIDKNRFRARSSKP